MTPLSPSIPLIMSVLVGFSLGMSLLLAVSLATAYRHIELPWQSRVAGFVMLLGLALTQLGNLQLLADNAAPTHRYIAVLFVQSFAFYWLLLGVLRPADRWRRLEWLLPVAVGLLAWLIPTGLGVAVSLAMGTLFSLHLAMLLYRLRALRRRFVVELAVIAAFALMGLTVAIVGLLTPTLFAWSEFASVYAGLIALGFFLVGWLLLAIPDLTVKTSAAVSSSYAISTLGNVDQAAALARLKHLLEVERIYQNDQLSLGSVAELMDLSPHQLSELVNSNLNLGYSRLIRSHRVEAAQRMLVDEPGASVLSVGLAVGFSSQSAFYVAFKEQLGIVPGRFRRDALKRANASKALPQTD